MKAMSILAFLALTAAAITPSLVFAYEEGAPAHPALQAIQNEAELGMISEPEAALYKLYAVQGSQLLPPRFEIKAEAPLKCATPIYEEVRKNLADMPEGMRMHAETALQRPYLPEYIDTEHFRIHYATSGQDVIYGWPSTAYRDAVMQSCEDSWDFFHTENGWHVPPSDGGAGGGYGLIDCYVEALSGVYGYAQAESPGPNFPWDYTAYFVIDNDYAGFGYADRTDPMKVTVAHEYHHVVQMGIHAGVSWWMENTSTFMEDEVYDEIDDNYQYLSCYLGVPYNRLDSTNGCWEYGCFLWPTYLKENWSHSLVRGIWDQYAEEVDIKGCFDGCLGPYGLNLDTGVAEWATWGVFTGNRDDGQHYEEATEYNRYAAYDRFIYSYPQYDVHPTATKKPKGLGTNYTKFQQQSGSTDNKITINYDGPWCTNDHMIVFARKFEDDPTTEVYEVDLDENGVAMFELLRWDETEWMFMVVPMTRMCGSSGQDFVFSVETSWEGTDVADLVKPTRIIRLDQNQPNPFNPRTKINYMLSEAGPVRIDIFDVTGRHVKTLVDGTQAAGEHQARWTGSDDNGHAVEPGLYFYKMQANGEEAVKKMIFVE